MLCKFTENAQWLMNQIETLLKAALDRKAKRLTYQTTYSHDNLYAWLKGILPTWEIFIPEHEKGSTRQSFPALSDWPTINIRDTVTHWVEEHNAENIEDFLDGLCEPLAFYLSNKIKQDIELRNFHSIKISYQSIKSELDSLEAVDAAQFVLGRYINQVQDSPLFWGEGIVGSYKHYLFGHNLAKASILEAAKNPAVNIMPLYVLNYIFDGDELSNNELKNTVEETAQYSLHVVGLVFDTHRSRLFIADPNGTLIPGSNMEFLSMPLEKRKAPASTKLSCFDLDSKKRKVGHCSSNVLISRPDGVIEDGEYISTPSGKRLKT
jgi:hypothetical protein